MTTFYSWLYHYSVKKKIPFPRSVPIYLKNFSCIVLALRAAVQAFHREEESQFSKAPKRRRDRFEHVCSSPLFHQSTFCYYILSLNIPSKVNLFSCVKEKCSYDDPFPLDLCRGKGVQFPFVVSDRVIIKVQPKPFGIVHCSDM